MRRVHHRRVRLYLAGPLFSEAERAFLDACARRLREAGFECFVPHEAAAQVEPATPARVFAVDFEALARAHALVAWVDGPQVDDGTACEIGLFRGLMEQREAWRKGIIALATDLRLRRHRDGVAGRGLNLFVAGAIEDVGRVCSSLDEVVDQLRAWRDPPRLD